jgi:hypothetical protein
MGLHQIKTLLHRKGNNCQNHKTACKKIFASYLFDKEAISGRYKLLKKNPAKETKNPFNKWENELNR